MATTTLAAIQQKVRRLTRSPSVNILPDADLNEYINTFVLYDFPEHLRLETLKKTLTFWTTPNVDTYNSSVTIGQLDNFKNVFTTIDNPVYVAGYQVQLYQDRTQFFNIYPATEYALTIGTGDGATTQFTGTLSNMPALARSVTFSAANANGTALVQHDVPLVTAQGLELSVANLYQWGSEPSTPPTVAIPSNALDYVTGSYTVTFASAPADGEDVTVQLNRYSPARPDTMLFYNNTFTLRPVPDKAYHVQLDAYVRPTELLAGQSPELEQWWQYIAYGAAKKVLEDRLETDILTQIMPEFKEQERLVQRRTIVNQTKQRAATIYTQQVDNVGNSYFGNNGNF